MTFWLLKTEPGDFSYDDLLERDVEPWDGVSSPFALANLKNAREGETCVIYHTGDEKRQAIGLAQVVRSAYQDPKKDNPRLLVIHVRGTTRLPRPRSRYRRSKPTRASPSVRWCAWVDCRWSRSPTSSTSPSWRWPGLFSYPSS